MKKLISAVLCLSMILSLGVFGIAESAAGEMQSQMETVVNPVDSGLYLGEPDGGYTGGMEIYPSPVALAGESTSIANPSSFRFLMVNLRQYSKAINGTQDYELDQNFYNSLVGTLQNAKNNGVCVGLRFRYDDRGVSNPEPAWNMLIHHFEQIWEWGILDEYESVIAYVEVGILGQFGEQHSTAYGNYGYSTELIDLLLNIVPESIPLSLRTSGRIISWVNEHLGTSFNENNIGTMVAAVKQNYSSSVNGPISYYSGDGKDFSTGNLISEDLARLGMYNDGYMGTLIDYGTFRNRAQETMFLNGQTSATYGGEFSGDRYRQIEDGSNNNTVWYPVNGIPEMYYTHLMNINGNIWKDATYSQSFSTTGSANSFINRLIGVYSMFNSEGTVTPYDTTSVSVNSDGTLTGSNTDISASLVDSKYKVTFLAPGYDNLIFTETVANAVNAKLGTNLDLSPYYGRTCFDFIHHHLGYRPLITSSQITGGTIQPGDSFSLSLGIMNSGFSNIVKEKEAEIILVQGSKKYSVPLSDVDARTWVTGVTSEVNETITLPAGIGGGEWSVYLRVSNKNTDAADDAKWAVKFANTDIYSSSLGANLVGKINISGEQSADGGFVETRPTGEYYTDPQTYSADADNIEFIRGTHIFKEDGKYGFTILFKIDGISDGSEINITRWKADGTSYSGSQLHSFNWFFKNNPTYTFGKTFTENGYYLMYCPFWSVGAYSGSSVAGTTKVSSFMVNYASTAREDKNYPSSLNGNEATITPLGIVEGAVVDYDITFHYGAGRNYTGSYSFKNTASAVTENCQFKLGNTVLSLYDGETPADYVENGIAYKFAGWTTQEGYAEGLIDENLIAGGTYDLYPYYEIDMENTSLDANVKTLTSFTDDSGLIYTLDGENKTASVGDGSSWMGNSGFTNADSDMCVIPGYVVSNGEYYKVTEISSNAFSGISSLKNIYIPSNVTTIATDAFDGITSSVVINTYVSTAAQSYAVNNSINCNACSTRNRYTVVYCNVDNEVVDVKSALNGTTVSSAVVLEKANDDTCCYYEFAGFDTDGVAITADTVAYPEFNSVDHIPGEIEVIQEGSCTEDKIYRICCEVCGKELERHNVPGAHSFTNYVSNGDATCEHDGTKTAECDICHNAYDTVTDEGSKLEHSISHGVIVTVAPNGGIGTKSGVCVHCGKTVTVTYTVQKYGDANRDGDVNNIDVTLLGRYLAGYEDDGVDLDALNVHDIKVGVEDNPNQVDLTKLVRYVAGWDGYSELG